MWDDLFFSSWKSQKNFFANRASSCLLLENRNKTKVFLSISTIEPSSYKFVLSKPSPPFSSFLIISLSFFTLSFSFFYHDFLCVFLFSLFHFYLFFAFSFIVFMSKYLSRHFLFCLSSSCMFLIYFVSLKFDKYHSFCMSFSPVLSPVSIFLTFFFSFFLEATAKGLKLATQLKPMTLKLSPTNVNAAAAPNDAKPAEKT